MVITNKKKITINANLHWSIKDQQIKKINGSQSEIFPAYN